VLQAYARAEAGIEAGPYRRYREVLAEVVARLGERFGFVPSAEERARFAASVPDWPPFPDSARALASLKERYGLGLITNCDDDLLGGSIAKLGIDFDWIVTAEQVGSYKPSPANFLAALERIGLPRERILHVAQSLFHDHVPAQRLGLRTAWVNRRGDKAGFGATPPATARPDFEVPDLVSLAERLRSL
jgi:2-haloacid dehalogenase